MHNFKKCPPEKPYYLMEVQAGERYQWCACGKSASQPFCDGSHKGSGISPVIFTAEETKDIFFCGCKRTATSPHCDGAHKLPQVTP